MDKLILTGGLLYYQHKPKYQLEEEKQFVVPQAHRGMAIDGCHQDAAHQGKKRQRVLSQINSGHQVSMKMWIEPSKIADVANSVGGRRRKLPCFQ